MLLTNKKNFSQIFINIWEAESWPGLAWLTGNGGEVEKQ